MHISKVSRRTNSLWLSLLPVLSGIICVPLVFLSIRFSLFTGQIAFYMVGIGTQARDLIGVSIVTLAGFLALIGVFICLFMAYRRHTWQWRLGFSIGAISCAGALPLSWVIFGFI